MTTGSYFSTEMKLSFDLKRTRKTLLFDIDKTIKLIKLVLNLITFTHMKHIKVHMNTVYWQLSLSYVLNYVF